jgi:hypothetical protein
MKLSLHFALLTAKGSIYFRIVSYTSHGLTLRFVIANEVKQSKVNKQIAGLLR